MSNPQYPQPPGGWPHQHPQGYGPPPGYWPPPPPPRRSGGNRTALWIVAAVFTVIGGLFAVGIALSPPHTPLCNAYRDLKDAMHGRSYDINSEITALSKQADDDPDRGVRADGRDLDRLGVLFDSNDVDAATRNIAAKC